MAPCLLLKISGVEVTPSVTSVELSEQFWRKICQIWCICEPWKVWIEVCGWENEELQLTHEFKSGIKQGEFFVLKETMHIHRIPVQAWIKLLHFILYFYLYVIIHKGFPSL